MPHELPTPPDGWVVSTNIEQHVAFLYSDGDRRSLALIAGSHPEAAEWRVRGLANYGPDLPLFTAGVSFDEAVETAVNEMEAQLEGNSIEPVDVADDDHAGEREDAGADASVVDPSLHTDGEEDSQQQSGLDDWL